MNCNRYIDCMDLVFDLGAELTQQRNEQGLALVLEYYLKRINTLILAIKQDNEEKTNETL